MKASVTLLIPTLLVLISQTERASTSLRYLTVACVQVPVKKIPECLPTGCRYLTKLLFPPLCPCVGVCIDVVRLNATERTWISPLVASVEIPLYAFHQPLPTPKTVLSSWGMVVICALIAPRVTGITAWCSSLQVQGVPGTIYESTAAYMYENMGCR